ncbi:MAG: SMC family ATPase, partial [Gammaproteobacteria bacterium]|nr:SMC family ATPase [Gammaproteobacteria bacterium]
SRLEKNVAEQQLRHVRQHEDDKLLLRKQLEEKTALIEDKTRPDINQLVETEKQLLVAKELTDSAYHKTQQRQHLLTTIRDKLKQSLEQQTKLESEYGVVGKLSDISNGKNPHNLSLQRFVLSVLLDDVLTEASSRLLKMSKGRYQLYRKETVGDKRTKAGLELEVEDAYTGKQRPAATLSGGESFMAALALALGLSDVVQAYAGGIRLDMLFIDEGFGSLDPESLELAINTLLDLRDSGRMVGIISHVEELKRMIDVRLDVVANREVSTTQLVGV